MFYLFQLGHQPQISTAEIQAVFHSKNLEIKKIIKHLNNIYLILEAEEKLNTNQLINQLGGTIKIGEEAGTADQLADYLIENFPTGKIEFSIDNPKLALQTKKELKMLGRSVRYIEPKNTATILHNKLVEKKSDLTIIDNKIFATTAIQPFEEMAKRDFARPGFDDKSGMLPPKLARIMINLAQINTTQTLLDPFCGSGTVLTEALSMGYTNLIGSDISPRAIDDTKKNLGWLSKSFNLPIFQSPNSLKLFISDASEISKHLETNSINAIVTEPYLGRPLHGNESELVIKKQIAELSKLYFNSFKEFYKILKKDGVVIFITPKFKLQEKWIKINIEKEIKKIGFEILPFDVQTHLGASLGWQPAQPDASLEYHRPSQHLAREIWRFKKS